jgi:hypothetical protein
VIVDRRFLDRLIIASVIASVTAVLAIDTHAAARVVMQQEGGWKGRGPLAVKPLEGTETVEYSFELSTRPVPGEATRIVIRGVDRSMRRDAWIYGQLRSECIKVDGDSCRYDYVHQVGSSSRLGHFAAPYSPDAGGVVINLEWPSVGTYRGYLRMIDGDRLAMATLRVEAGAGEPDDDTYEQRLPLSLLGRTIPRQSSGTPPPGWLKPAAYALLAILAAAGVWLVLSTPKQIGRRSEGRPPGRESK